MSVFFQSLQQGLPPEIAGELLWAVRSPGQETLAREMEEQRLQYWDRIVRYADLAIPGEVEVYSPGIAAGRLRALLPGDPGLERSDSRDILALGFVPDWLPPAAGLLTAVPQTPLAHINILARNRGIPNAYLGGLLDDPEIGQLARGQIPMLVYADAPDHLEILTITGAQYQTYLGLLQPQVLGLPEVDLQAAPLFLDLLELNPGEADELRPLIGGKSAGIAALEEALPDPRGRVAAPDLPLAITMKAYVEHLEPLLPRIEAMLQSEELEASATTRLLVLEGVEGLAKRGPEEEASDLARGFLADHPPGDPLGDLVREGGLVELIREQPVRDQTLEALHRALTERFGHYATEQGLRFRSSSNVEDIEGFNAAGLYDSNTGFDSLHLDDRGSWRIESRGQAFWGDGLRCRVEVLYAGPEDYLLGLLRERGQE